MINDKHFEKFPYLESERLIFRAFNLNDAKDIQHLRSNDKVLDHMDSEPHRTVKDSEILSQKTLTGTRIKRAYFGLLLKNRKIYL